MEKGRLDTVKEFLRLQLSNQADLQDLVYLASEICQTPIASITFVDDKKQHPVVGLGAMIESSCDIAFCSHTMKQEGILEVTDASTDPRFISNPLVTNDPHIRFYAGAPLKTATGYTVGTLCVIDQQPKKLTSNQLRSLEILSKQVMHRLEVQLTAQKITDSVAEVERNMELLEQAEVMQNVFFNNCDDYFLLLNNQLEIVSFNRAAANAFDLVVDGSSLEKGEKIWHYLQPANVAVMKQVFGRAKKGHTVEIELLANAGTENSFRNKVTVLPARNSRNEMIGIACIGCNIEKEKMQEEKIRNQHAVLNQIAQLHSHQIRHPLANILGIIDLIKHDGFEVNNQFVQYLETAAKELDSVIRKIVLDSYKAA